MKKQEDREALLHEFQEKIGYFYNNKKLLEEALTHSSYANESGLLFYNERLEFLGDSVLELIASEMLYKEFQDLDEGKLTRLRSQLVCQNSLKNWAEEVGLNKLIKLGKSLIKDGPSQSVEADTAEAILGSVFLDGGYASASRIIIDFLKKQKNNASIYAIDPKTTLQQATQSKNGSVPYYKTVERKGPDHSLKFRVQVTLNEKILAEAWGNTIKEAEFKAAEEALKNI